MKSNSIKWVITNDDRNKFATGMDSFTSFVSVANLYHMEEEAALDLSDWLDQCGVSNIEPVRITIEFMEE